MTEPGAGAAAGQAEVEDAYALPRQPANAVVAVRVGETEFGLPVRSVREVIRTPAISRVPFPPPDVVGLIGVRGVLLPVLDLGLRLSNRPSTRPGVILVAEEPQTLEPIALLVDRVVGLFDPSGTDVREPPAEAEVTLPPGWVAFVYLLEPGRTVTVLDLRAVLPNPERRGDDRPAPHSPSDSEP